MLAELLWFSSCLGAKLIALLEPEKTEQAAKILCKLDSTFNGVDIKVS